ncbi:hypothetical protein F8O01_15095 [Pseudoclavibacter chungangensis]|uniref:Uncharacterized protein n=1 Tax=Pseudoclavibacter chungangensis TaxID=587635 RepID=A0A7J5BN40_9MICO|nr:hypothetical protein F8O01_15095 [Pseudoclavibacter chungangensis]
MTRGSRLVARCSLCAARGSRLAARCSLLVVRGSRLVARAPVTRPTAHYHPPSATRPSPKRSVSRLQNLESDRFSVLHL